MSGPWPEGAESAPVNTLAFLTGTLLGTATRLFRADATQPHVDRDGRRVSTLILMENGTRVALTLELVGDDEHVPPPTPIGMPGRATQPVLHPDSPIRPTEQKWQEADPEDLAEPGWSRGDGPSDWLPRRRRKTTAAERQVPAEPRVSPGSAAVPDEGEGF